VYVRACVLITYIYRDGGLICLHFTGKCGPLCFHLFTQHPLF